MYIYYIYKECLLASNVITFNRFIGHKNGLIHYYC